MVHGTNNYPPESNGDEPDEPSPPLDAWQQERIDRGLSPWALSDEEMAEVQADPEAHARKQREKQVRAHADFRKIEMEGRELARQEFEAEQQASTAILLPGLSLRDELAMPEPERRFAIDQLASAGSIVTLPSSRKTGKTTFIANLIAAGVDGQPFLGEFATHLEGRVVAFNAEMGRYDYLDPFRRLGIRNDDRICPVHCRDDGIRLNLLNDAVAEQVTKFLKIQEAQWMFLDPWKNFLAWAGGDIKDNGLSMRLISRIQEIHAAAGLGLTLIAMHTTQSAQEAGFERAKGAGEVEDSADALWRYTRATGGRGGARVLSVEGRGGAGLDETIVEFDQETGRLTLGEGDRGAAEADLIAPDITGYVEENPDSSGRDIEAAMRDLGHGQTITRRALKRLVSKGTIETRTGPKRATLHRIPDTSAWSAWQCVDAQD